MGITEESVRQISSRSIRKITHFMNDTCPLYNPQGDLQMPDMQASHLAQSGERIYRHQENYPPRRRLPTARKGTSKKELLGKIYSPELSQNGKLAH